jgi:hypothetical protein
MNSRKMMNNCKRRGEWAELQFMAKAAKLGLGVSKPWGGGDRNWWTIRKRAGQVNNPPGRGRLLYMQGPARQYQRALSTRRIRFPGGLCIAKDVWYIIPARLVANGKKRAIRPYTSSPTSKYAPYKEAWDLLR